MSADTTPISSARFAAALTDLSIEMLHLKTLEIRNSIAHLQYSNDQLRPFADGTQTAVSTSETSGPSGAASNNDPDQDCIDAIKENDTVIDRMAERIAIIRAEVEGRGLSWDEFRSAEEVLAAKAGQEAKNTATPTVNGHADHAQDQGNSPWTDGTFQAGTIRNGEITMDQRPGQPSGGSLSDEQLRQVFEERMGNLDTDEDEGGMHL
ncbi:uncharacterized protein J7T54_005930 [Emericellopsis cladophorae]|uniref:Translation machinery-associated protein 17 n=1 Tax=Emericellopsis cladophorae TaxID=2686198 RepID=A0A9P9Y8V1_9HYPO|nr:uncharacterized protein J7T54_005930 [Emericellopsis cladophorae]KAI6785596.1 hypothetical protein J7T54_005930 [Emericellopsis cladophorae]